MFLLKNATLKGNVRRRFKVKFTPKLPVIQVRMFSQLGRGLFWSLNAELLKAVVQIPIGEILKEKNILNHKIETECV